MSLRYDNTRSRRLNESFEVERVEEKSPAELFGELYEKQNNQPMSKEQEKFVKELIEECWREDV
jgi:exonuclease SbcD